MKQFLVGFVIILLFWACQSKLENKTVKNTVVSDEKYYNAKDAVRVFDSISISNKKYQDSIAHWKGYHSVKESLEKYKKTSPNEVLAAAAELVKNVQLMRDSITVVTLQEKGIRARINALYNQALRLQEMKDIPAITVSEVEKQTRGLFVIFRMINHKITAIYEQNKFEKELLKEKIFFSKLDSIP